LCCGLSQTLVSTTLIDRLELEVYQFSCERITQDAGKEDYGSQSEHTLDWIALDCIVYSDVRTRMTVIINCWFRF